MTLDARALKHRLLECTRCHERVASPAWSGRMVVRCESCGLDQERDLTLDGPPESELGLADGDGPYRSGPRAEDARPSKLGFALGDLLPGHPVESLDLAKLRAALARSPREGEDAGALEWERVWIAVWLACMRSIQLDHVGARVALETTLLVTRAPEYRALLLARLAQHAAAIGAPRLAKKWLRACPAVDVAEVTSEIRAARALIALAGDETAEARRMTGDRRAGEGFCGNALFLAIAINIEAHERLDDPAIADTMLADLRRKKLLTAVMAPIKAFGVGTKSLARLEKNVRKRSAIRSALFAAIVILVVPALESVQLGATLLAALVATAGAGAIEWFTLGAKSTTRRGRWGWVLLGMVLNGALMAAGVWWQMHHRIAAAPPPPVVEHAPASSTHVVPPGAIELRLDEDAMGDDELLAQARSDLYFEDRAADAERLLGICARRHPANEECVKMLAAAKAARAEH